MDGLSVYEQRRRKEQMLAEKRRKVAEMKRQQELALQRIRKQRENNVDSTESNLLNDEERERSVEENCLVVVCSSLSFVFQVLIDGKYKVLID